MEVLIFLLVLAFIGWATFTQVSARQQTSVSCPHDVATARAIVARCFGRTWGSVEGKGDLNYRPRARKRAPVISISFDAAARGGTDVDIWCSAGTKRYGLLEHGQLVWRKKRAVVRALVPPAQSRTPASAQALRDRTAAVGPPRTPLQVPRYEQPVPRYEHSESPAPPSACAHTPTSYMEFGDQIKRKGDPPYPYREFWHVERCTKCGRELHREADEYYGEDMADIHWKWRR